MERTRQFSILIILLVAGLVSGSAVWAKEGFSKPGDPVPQNLETIWNATVRVQNQIRSFGSTAAAESLGTGVIVALDHKSLKAIVATNSHVGGCPPGRQCLPRVELRNNSNLADQIKVKSTRRLKDYPNLDLALLEIELTGELKLPGVNTLDNADSTPQRVYAIGFPDLRVRGDNAWKSARPSNWDSTKRISEGSTAKLQQGILKKGYPTAGDATVTLKLPKIVYHDADTLSGNSGGPLVDESGRILGLVSGILSPPSGHPYCPYPEEPMASKCRYFAVPVYLILQKLEELE